MASIKSNNFLVTCVLILVALSGVAVGKNVHRVGDWNDWSDYGFNYEDWASSRTFQVGDSLIFQFNKDLHDVTQVTHNDFELCDTSKPLARYHESVLIHLTKPGLQSFICGFPGHCQAGQKLEILVLPASLGPVAAPLPRLVQSPLSTSSSSPSPSPAQAQSAASSTSSVWIRFFSFLPLLCLLILV